MTPGLEQALGRFHPRLPLAVALSGGADSCALLMACARRWPGQVRALHVHHGLQAAADDFERHCVALCARLGVPLDVTRVDARHATGESPEDAARIARYTALAAAAARTGCATVALAQHADDQVETLLLALSRGAGLAGLAGMRGAWDAPDAPGVRFERPLLEVRGEDLREALREAGEDWVEDPSNADGRFTRNRIRAGVLPALASAFPSFRETFARSARHAAQAQALLDEIAAEDLPAAGDPPAIEALRALGRPRRANLLRHWLRTRHGTQASSAQMEELLDQLEACATRGHAIRIKVGQGFVLREGARLLYSASV